MERVLHWVSFATDDGFRGACFLFAHNVADAAARAWELGINPGGEVLAVAVPADAPAELREKMLANLNRLIQKPELLELFPDVYRVGDRRGN